MRKLRRGAALLLLLVAPPGLAQTRAEEGGLSVPAEDEGRSDEGPPATANVQGQEQELQSEENASTDEDLNQAPSGGAPPSPDAGEGKRTGSEAASAGERRAGAPETAEGAESEAENDTAAEKTVADDDGVRSLDAEIAGADLTGSPVPPPREPAPAMERVDNNEDRPLPDYSGRPPPAASAGDVLIWVPRVLLFPAYLVMEYLIRRPIVWSVTEVERLKIAEYLTEAFTWDGGNGSIYPMINFDFGVRPNIGLVARWQNIFPRHDVYLAGFVGPRDLWAASFELEQHLFRDQSATLHYLASYTRRPDAVYFGLDDQPSPCKVSSEGCRYRTAILEGQASLRAFEDYLSGVEFSVLVRQARFSTQETDLPPVSQAEAGTLPGFGEGYVRLAPELHLTLDTRAEDVDFTRGTGVRLEGFGSGNIDLQNLDSRWFSAGFEMAGFFDFGTGQIVGARLYGETTANISHRDSNGERPDIPFHELIALGGSDRMRGFLSGRLRGHHAWTATLEYRYPIMWALDAGMFTSIGNVYESVSDFDIRRNYLNYGLTLRLTGDRGSAFESVIGFGSNRLDAPSFDAFDQFRFTVGINQGF